MLSPSRSLERPSHLLPAPTINPRGSLSPLEPPPVKLSDYPSLPVSTSRSSVLPRYALSTHVFLAAYPTCPSDVWVPSPANESRSEKKERVAKAVAYLSSIKEAQEDGRDLRPSRGEVLWTVANRYVKMSPASAGSGGLTLVFLHGIGAYKESWEPILDDILHSLTDSHSSVEIREIWSLDAVQHGDSGLLNEPLLGDIFDNADYARDVANFMTYYLPESMVDGGALPVNLLRLPASVKDRRKVHGYTERTVVAIGHSMGAHSLVYPAIECPALFSALVMVEAAVYPKFLEHTDAGRKFESGCLSRRWMWDSRSSAIEDISKSGYYRSWQADIVRHYCEHSLIETADGKWRLKTQPYLEGLMLFERRSVYETWEVLNRIHPRVFIHWIWGGRSERAGGPAVQAQTTFRRAENCSNDYHADLQHLLPQESPKVVAVDIARFLKARYGVLGNKL